MRIAIDAMGGDQAPGKILDGAFDALSLLEPDDQLILVGQKEVIQQHAGDRIAAAGSRIEIEHASQIVTMLERFAGRSDPWQARFVHRANG